MTYRLIVKYKGCQGESCRRCEHFIPGFFEDMGSQLLFTDRIIDDPERWDMITGAIDNCPAGVLGWERATNKNGSETVPAAA